VKPEGCNACAKFHLNKVGHFFLGNGKWWLPFQLPEGSLDVALVCELNTFQGSEVSFDLDSLQAKRIAAPQVRQMNRQLVLPK